MTSVHNEKLYRFEIVELVSEQMAGAQVDLAQLTVRSYNVRPTHGERIFNVTEI
jgi:hypothetical protein